MSLEQILKQIKETKPFAEENVEEGPAETLNGRRGRKNRAIEELTLLKRQYRRDVLQTAQFLIVAGSLRNELSEALTTGEMGLFSADPEFFYKDLSSRVNPALYQGRSTVNDLFDVLGRILEDKANELDISAYPQLIFKERYVRKIENQSQFTNLIKMVINEQMGTEVVGIQSVNSIIDKAIEKGHDKKTTSIVLNTEDDQLTLDLLKDLTRLTSRVFLLVAGNVSKTLKNSSVMGDAILVKKVNEETVKQTIEALKALKNSK